MGTIGKQQGRTRYARGVHHAYGAAFSALPLAAFPTSRHYGAGVPTQRTPSGMAASSAAVNLGALTLRRGGYGAMRVTHGPYGDPSAALDKYAPAVTQIAQYFFDPRKQVAGARANLARAIAAGKPEWKIQELRDKLAAVEAIAADRQGAVDEGRAWQSGITRNLWLVSGVVVGLGLLTFAGAYRVSRGR